MISKIVVFHCPKSHSTNVVKNGKNSAGRQQFLCKDSSKSAVMYPQNQRSQAAKDQILSAYHERPSMRGIVRTFHISRDTLKKMLKKSKRTIYRQGELIACKKRGCAGIRRSLVVCLHQNRQGSYVKEVR